MNKKKYLAIFDLDGTLFDTGMVNYLSYYDALLPYGIELEQEYFVTRCNGRHYTEFLPEIMGTSEHLEAVHKAKKNAYRENLGKARENKHLFQMIKNIQNEYYVAIVTTASRKNTIDILSHFDYEGLFDLIISQEDITKVKPNPEGFLLAMQKFNISAEHTMIFEDSDVGIMAARASGATVMVANKF